MPVIRAENAPVFSLPGVAVVGLASPSRGSHETSVWRLKLRPGAPGAAHSVDREEIFIALAGRAVAHLGDEPHELGPGDTLIVPSGVLFSLSNPGPDVFEAVAVAPVGLQAKLPGGEFFSPPWTL